MLLLEGCLNESALMTYPRVLPFPLLCVEWIRLGFSSITIRVDVVDTPEGYIRIGVEIRHASFYHSVVIKAIAGIHEIHVVACRGSHALVHGIVNAVVRLRHPIGNSVGVFLYYVDGAVGRSAVDNYVFHIGICLVEHGQNCAL